MTSENLGFVATAKVCDVSCGNIMDQLLCVGYHLIILFFFYIGYSDIYSNNLCPHFRETNLNAISTGKELFISQLRV